MQRPYTVEACAQEVIDTHGIAVKFDLSSPLMHE